MARVGRGVVLAERVARLPELLLRLEVLLLLQVTPVVTQPSLVSFPLLVLRVVVAVQLTLAVEAVLVLLVSPAVPGVLVMEHKVVAVVVAQVTSGAVEREVMALQLLDNLMVHPLPQMLMVLVVGGLEKIVPPLVQVVPVGMASLLYEKS